MPHWAVPPLDLADGLGLVRLLHDVDDVGAADEARGKEKQHHDYIGCEREREQIGLRIKGKRHLLRVNEEGAEQLPDAPSERRTQHRARGARDKRDEREFAAQLAAKLPTRRAEREEHPCFARLLAEEQPSGVGGEHRAAEDCEHEHHHHLLAAVAALGQDGEDGGRTHHARIRGDEQHGKEAAAGEQPVLPAVFAAQRRIDFGKGFHRLVTSCKVKLFARSAHEIRNCGAPQFT